MMAPKEKYIPIKTAMEITGRQTGKAVAKFIENWNFANKDHLILCMPGYVEENSLRHALHEKAKKHTPAMSTRRAITSPKRGAAQRQAAKS